MNSIAYLDVDQPSGIKSMTGSVVYTMELRNVEYKLCPRPYSIRQQHLSPQYSSRMKDIVTFSKVVNAGLPWPTTT